MFQCSGAIADQGCALDWRTDDAVAHTVSFGTGEHEFAIGDVDLPAAEANRINPVLEIGDDGLRVCIATQHEGVGHARHRRMGIALPAPVTGCRHPHQPGVLPILHIAHQHPVLDQDIAPGCGAFVIDADRAAPVGDRPVIDDGHALGGHILAHEPGKGRLGFAVEIAFKPVPDGFMQKDSRPAGAKHDVHDTGGCVLCLQIDQRDPERFAGHRFPFFPIQRNVHAKSTATAGGSGLAAAVLFDDCGDIDTGERPGVCAAAAVGAEDFDFLHRSGNHRRGLNHAVVQTAQIGVNLPQKVNLCRKAAVPERIGVRI